MLAIALCIGAPVRRAAAEDAPQEDVWVDPKLDPDAIPWDEKHPELLEEEMCKHILKPSRHLL